MSTMLTRQVAKRSVENYQGCSFLTVISFLAICTFSCNSTAPSSGNNSPNSHDPKLASSQSEPNSNDSNEAESTSDSSPSSKKKSSAPKTATKKSSAQTSKTGSKSSKGSGDSTIKGAPTTASDDTADDLPVTALLTQFACETDLSPQQLFDSRTKSTPPSGSTLTKAQFAEVKTSLSGATLVQLSTYIDDNCPDDPPSN